ncbi:hypothetical protein Clacol_000438 [Clathrus columnatus]|uniref:Fungal lipase-type domain-containing protein n=1 Tax=Clathrus columnatus TaxID=1419009 RepID=A0AAV4ZYG0_9AGAM|nr:hypothetical protein Clacol_000438 [Clathrus columnatus]
MDSNTIDNSEYATSHHCFYVTPLDTQVPKRYIQPKSVETRNRPDFASLLSKGTVTDGAFGSVSYSYKRHGMSLYRINHGVQHCFYVTPLDTQVPKRYIQPKSVETRNRPNFASLLSKGTVTDGAFGSVSYSYKRHGMSLYRINHGVQHRLLPFVQMSSTYNCYQQVFGISLASNAVRTCTGTQVTLQKALQSVIPGLINTVGPWKISWGPVVYKAVDLPNTGPDNAWYVAHHPSLQFPDGSQRSTYVVAIAGTADTYDLLEDFEVRSVIDFHQWVNSGIRNMPSAASNIIPGNAYIAYGTGTASHTIITYPAPPNAIGAALTPTLFSYLLTLPSNSTVIFTGHSLGGALSPTVALATKSANILRVSDVLTYPTAGPSPGNDAFTNLFRTIFPQIRSGPDYQSWNINFINTLDIVPKAWCTRSDLKPDQNMGQIPALYGEIQDPNQRSEVERDIKLAEYYSELSRVTYLPLDAIAFPGPPPTQPPATKSEFIAIAISQHVQDYEHHFQIPVNVPSCPAMGLKDLDKESGSRKRRQEDTTA